MECTTGSHSRPTVVLLDRSGCRQFAPRTYSRQSRRARGCTGWLGTRNTALLGLSSFRHAIILLNPVLLSEATVLLNACNTTAGAGQDVSAVGHAVTNSAEKVKSGL
jgi:predicted small secreted protein